MVAMRAAILATLVAACSATPRTASNATAAACPGSSPTCDCSWTRGGALCKAAGDDGSECFCRCCCAHKQSGFSCKWHGSGPPPPPPPPTPPPPPAPPPHTGALNGIKIAGNHLVDSQTGGAVTLRGVSHSSTEYACVQGHGLVEGPVNSSFVAGLKSWKNLNVVRLPLNEDCWLGINGVPAAASGPAYQAGYKKLVELLTNANIAVLADLHWTAPGSTLATKQDPLPDADHAAQLWYGVADSFKDNPLVLFELFNEPFAGTASAQTADWSCWRNGGSCPGVSDVPYQAAGMESLIKSVRSTGATNVILLGGMAWSNDLSQWNRWAPLDADPLQQTGAVWHAYDFNSCHDQHCWEQTISPVAARVPVVVTECGFDISWTEGLWAWIEKQHGAISYLAWTWNTWGGNEGLVSDYAKGTPTSPWGRAFQAQIAQGH
jgi:endoglucanase